MKTVKQKFGPGSRGGIRSPTATRANWGRHPRIARLLVRCAINLSPCLGQPLPLESVQSIAADRPHNVISQPEGVAVRFRFLIDDH